MTNQMKTKLSILGGSMTIMLLTGCSFSQVELKATATQTALNEFATQTAEALKASPTPIISTRIPTVTPTATPIPTDTPTPIPIPTDTSTLPPAPQCKLETISPVAGFTDPITGASIPSYDFLAVGFLPNQMVVVTLNGSTQSGNLTLVGTSIDFLQADEEGMVEGNITWQTIGGSTPIDMMLKIEPMEEPECAASQPVTWSY
jgi:hypothetical protein